MFLNSISCLTAMSLTVHTAHAFWIPDQDYAKRAEPSSAETEPKTQTKKDTSSAKPAPTSEKVEPTSKPTATSKKNEHTSTHEKSSANATGKSSAHEKQSQSSGSPTANITSATGTTISKSTISPTGLAAEGSDSGGSSAGMIGGIVAIIAVVGLGAAAFLIVRKKKKARQNMRARMSSKPDPFTMGYGNNDPPAQNFPPPSAYKAEAAFDNYQVTPISQSNAEAIQSKPIAIGSYVVIATYIPTLSDELEIEPGDHIELLVEYDDGWCQGINMTKGNTKGVFPRHCIDYATVPSNHAPNSDIVRSKRISSMIQK